MRTAWVSIGFLLAALTGLLLLEGDSSPAERPRTDVAVIVPRVEELRGLKFTTRPVPVRVTPEIAREEGLEDLDRSYPESRREADEAVLKRLGLIEADVDLRDISASIFGEGVAGYYDPRTKQLAIVDGAVGTSPALDEIVIAHELNHALEDQRFGLKLGEGETDDVALARHALIEGTATLLMTEYLTRHIGLEDALGGLLGSAMIAGPDIPPFLMNQLLFPYLDGMTFAQTLKTRGGQTWKLVDLAERVRPPESTEQILHPEKWIEVESPLPVTLNVSLEDGWTKALVGTWGEWQTRELLGGVAQAEAAAGWGGDRYELWQRGDEDVLVMRWLWDTPEDAREFLEALRAAPIADAPGAAIEERDGAVTLVLAPSVDLAQRLASSA